MCNCARYDIFILLEFWEIVDNPQEVYEKMSQFIQETSSEVTLEHVAWETDLCALREEAIENSNQNCGLSHQQLLDADLSDWQKFLSTDERNNYKAYLEKLNMHELPKESRSLRAVCVSQDPKAGFTMMGNATQLPTFTKDSTKRIMLTSLDRWLTTSEKMAVTGFPCHQD